MPSIDPPLGVFANEACDPVLGGRRKDSPDTGKPSLVKLGHIMHKAPDSVGCPSSRTHSRLILRFLLANAFADRLAQCLRVDRCACCSAPYQGHVFMISNALPIQLRENIRAARHKPGRFLDQPNLTILVLNVGS